MFEEHAVHHFGRNFNLIAIFEDQNKTLLSRF